jgi:hypothetical protein
MPKVKIIYCEEVYSDYETGLIGRDNITGWEEISDEELKLLQMHWHRINYKHKLHDLRPTLIVEYENTVPKVLQSVKDYIADAKRDAIEYERKRQEKAKIRAAKKLKTEAQLKATKIEKLRAELQRLEE